MTNVDPQELEKFNAMAQRWWDPRGEFRALHDLNPLRTDFVVEHCAVEQAEVLDVGCGAGLLSEALAARGAQLIGIDLADKALQVARLHRLESQLEIDYRAISAEDLAAQRPASFDTVTCLEMLEHVPEPSEVIAAIAQLLKPGGRCVLSTINRGLKSFALAIVGAEYLLRLLPRGTHDYERLIRPSELTAWCRQAGLELVSLRGLHYAPWSGRAWSNNDVSVNYIACYAKAE